MLWRSGAVGKGWQVLALTGPAPFPAGQCLPRVLTLSTVPAESGQGNSSVGRGALLLERRASGTRGQAGFFVYLRTFL